MLYTIRKFSRINRKLGSDSNAADGPLYRPTCLDPGTHSLKNTSLFPLDILHSRLSHVLYGEVKLFKVKSLTGVAGEQ